MAKVFFILMGDMHVGSTTGLMSPAGAMNQDCNLIHPNSLQLEIGRHWMDTFDRLSSEVSELKQRGFSVVVINVGDVTDGDHHATTQIWGNPEQHQDHAVQLLLPYTRMAHLSYHILGSEAHSGPESSRDWAVARELGATQYRSRWASSDARVSFDGFVVDMAHEGASPGNTPWTFENSVRSYAKSMIMWDLAQNRTPPDLIVRGHVHISCIEYVQTGKYSTMIVVLPSWQWRTVWAAAKGNARRVSDIGLTTVLVDGEMIVPKVHSLKYDAAPVEVAKL